ncbi:hypothetical protein PVL29_001060 [Vitis rotundifolia]|uniref:Uncharacterized protein n=1 Tax=Vitis rotundifolia TaxID=103349 RepID=A0AA39ECH8_VITRO|nr:hypothetical protein PVL29_001060 [Vitis rotundifolia]
MRIAWIHLICPIIDQEWVAFILTVLCSKASYIYVKDLTHSALELALAKANQTLVHIRELFKNTIDPVLYRFYGICIDEYQEAVIRHLPGVISALESNNYESADTCEHQFVPKKSPMVDENKECSHARTLTFLF